MFSPVRIELRSSPSLKWGLVSLHLFTLVWIYQRDFELITLVVCSLIIILNYLYLKRLPVNQGVKTILWNADVPLFITIDNSNRSITHPHPQGILVLPFMLCLKLKAVAPVPNQWLVLMPDMMSVDQWRRVNVLARMSELDR